MNDDLEELLAAYVEKVDHLKEALAGLSEQQLDLALDMHSWSIRQYTQHIVDGDYLWDIGLRVALGELEVFDLQWYTENSQMEWSQIWNYGGRAIQPALDLLQANRQYTAQMVRCIPSALEKCTVVRWSDDNQRCISVKEIIEMHINHVSGHIEDIRAIRSAHGC
jgi:hypothetical protein